MYSMKIPLVLVALFCVVVATAFTHLPETAGPADAIPVVAPSA